MKIIAYSLVLIMMLEACQHKQRPLGKLDKQWIDSIIHASDSNFSKPYYRTDFVTAIYYLNKKDSTICQIMKDSSNNIRQITVMNKDQRTFFGQYYKNGNMLADIPLDAYGQFHGKALYYYESGIVQAQGQFLHGVKIGEWQYFTPAGKPEKKESYDKPA